MYLSPGAPYQITLLSHRYTLYSALHDPYPTFYTVIKSKQDFDLVLKIGTWKYTLALQHNVNSQLILSPYYKIVQDTKKGEISLQS